MSRKDDDSVEKFFRKAASQYDTQYNEGDWQKLEQRLDEEAARLAVADAPRVAQGKRTGTIIIIALLIIGIPSYLAYKNYFDTSRPERESIVGNTGEKALLSDTDEKTIEENINAQEEFEGSSILREQAIGRASGKEPESSSVIQYEVEKSSRSLASSTEEGKSLHTRESGSIVREKEGAATGSATAQQAQVRDRNQTGLKDTNTSDKSISDVERAITENEHPVGLISKKNQGQLLPEGKDLPGLPESNPFQHDSGQGDPIVDSALIANNVINALTQEPDSDPAGEKRIAGNTSRFSVRLVIAPDFSSTTFGNYTSPGEAYGMLVHYHVRQWNISTGILRSTKKYYGSGDEYKPPQGYWRYATNGVIPEKVDGNCVVLEIPLSIAFNVIEARRGRLYATAGVSSYLMRSENYRYTFEATNPGAQGWSTDKPSSYLFNIGSLSLGYERDISPALAFGLEPYYRVPFSGVGWANVSLHSTGVFFSVRYRFLTREHPPPFVRE